MRNMPDLADLIKLTPGERKALMALLKRAESPMSSPEYVKRCLTYRTKLEEQCEAEGLKLAHVFTASDPEKAQKQKEYKHPRTGEIFIPRKGVKRPAWVKAMDSKKPVANLVEVA